MEIKNVYQLINEYYKHNPNGHFFDEKTLKFFGEMVSEMRILKNATKITDVSGEKHICYVLSSLQRKHPLGARRVYHYFDTETLDHVIV